MTTATFVTGTQTMETAAAETELTAAARRCGLAMRELAAKMGVSSGYLSEISTGRKPWTLRMRERAMSVLGEVPGQKVIYRQVGVVSGESSYIRERARALGMSMRDPGGTSGGELRLHDGGVAGPQEHGREGPGAGRVGIGGSGEDRACQVRLH